MKKWLILVLLICPIMLKAECNYDKHTEYTTFAQRIQYETEYSMGDSKFTVTFYNVIKGLKLKMGKTTYEPDENDTVILSGMEEGKLMDIYVYGNDGCNSQVHNISFTLPYYNPYFGTEICRGYENLTLCASKFTETKATKKMIEKTKESYDNVIIQDKNPNETVEEEEKFISKAWNFFTKYVLKVILAIASAGIAIVYYDNKLSKVEHGI